MHRRQFLDPQRLLKTAGQIHAALGDAVPEPEKEPAPPDALLLHFTRPAMATVFEIVLPFGTPHAHAAASDALDLIDALESQMTVYRDDSEVSRINREAATTAIPVEEKLFALFLAAEKLQRESGGAFDIATGQLIKAWGFFRGPPAVPSPDELKTALSMSGMDHVALDPDAQTIRFRIPGMEINLGSIGKGYALDRAAAQMRSIWGIGSALFHGGRSSVLAMGHAPGSQRGWAVGLKHPWNEAELLGVVHLHDQALGTSAATFKHLIHRGRKLGHILDPRTGWPASGVASASVIAPTATEADALATAFYVQGETFTRDYCAKHPHVGAFLLLEGQTQLRAFGTFDME